MCINTDRRGYAVRIAGLNPGLAARLAEESDSVLEVEVGGGGGGVDVWRPDAWWRFGGFGRARHARLIRTGTGTCRLSTASPGLSRDEMLRCTRLHAPCRSPAGPRGADEAPKHRGRRLAFSTCGGCIHIISEFPGISFHFSSFRSLSNVLPPPCGLLSSNHLPPNRADPAHAPAAPARALAAWRSTDGVRLARDRAGARRRRVVLTAVM